MPISEEGTDHFSTVRVNNLVVLYIRMPDFNLIIPFCFRLIWMPGLPFLNLQAEKRFHQLK